MRCIFCLEEREPTVEHVYQQAIGGTLTIDRVCNPCNSFLGSSVDALLVDHPAIVTHRDRLRISSKAGVPDAFGRMLGGLVGTLANDPDQKIRLTPEPATGRLAPRLIPKRTKITLPDGREVIQWRIDEQDLGQLGKILQRERHRANLPPLNGAGLQTELDRILAGERNTADKPEVLYNLSFDMVGFKRGVLKIAYELAWRWFGDDYLEDPSATRLRDAVLHGLCEGEGGNLRASVELGAEVAPFSLWSSEQNLHLGFATPVGRGIGVGVRIFTGASGIVLATNDALRYPAFADGSLGMFLSLNPLSGQRRETTFSDEIRRLCRHGAVGLHRPDNLS